MPVQISAFSRGRQQRSDHHPRGAGAVPATPRRRAAVVCRVRSRRPDAGRMASASRTPWPRWWPAACRAATLARGGDRGRAAHRCTLSRLRSTATRKLLATPLVSTSSTSNGAPGIRPREHGLSPRSGTGTARRHVHRARRDVRGRLAARSRRAASPQAHRVAPYSCAWRRSRASHAPLHAVAIAVEAHVKALGHSIGLDIVDVERRARDPTTRSGYRYRETARSWSPW